MALNSPLLTPPPAPFPEEREVPEPRSSVLPPYKAVPRQRAQPLPVPSGPKPVLLWSRECYGVLRPAAPSHALGRALRTDGSSAPQELPLPPEHQSDRPQPHLLHAPGCPAARSPQVSTKWVSPVGAGSPGAPAASSAVRQRPQPPFLCREPAELPFPSPPHPTAAVVSLLCASWGRTDAGM